MAEPITTQPVRHESSTELAQSTLGLENSRRNRAEQICCNIWDCIKGTFYACIDVCCEDECCCCRKYFINRRPSRRYSDDDDDDDNNMWVNDNALPMIEERPKSEVTNSNSRNSSQQATISDSGDKSDETTQRVTDLASAVKNRNSMFGKDSDESASTVTKSENHERDSRNHTQNSDRDDSKQVEESSQEGVTHEGNHNSGGTTDTCDTAASSGGAADCSGNDVVE